MDFNSLADEWERRAGSWAEFQQIVNEITNHFSYREIVWRGARRSEWGIVSSLDRALRFQLDRPPSEDEANTAERRMLDLARREWRYDDMPAMELMAHLQHFGAPTRFLDVTANPLIALWFAVESRDTDNSSDGRVFGFTLNRKDIHYHQSWAGRYPRWHGLKNENERRNVDWGTGFSRRVWRPPAFNTRIAAQNSAFLVDGLPIDNFGRPTNKSSHWDYETLRDVSSINIQLSQTRPLELKPTSAPVFTIRIDASAKAEIRDQIERRYGYSAASIYSDINGLAQYIASNPALLVERDR